VIQEERAPTSRPARVGVLQAIRRYPFVAIAPMIVLAALGAALGYVRSPVYTATAQLAVGQPTATDPAALGNVVQASATLAGVYSRMINATDVKRSVFRAVGRPAASSGISATPVPDSPLVKVSATASSARTAVVVANAGARSLTAYVRKVNDPSGGARAIFRRFRAAALKYVQQLKIVDKLKSRYAQSATTSNQHSLDQGEADLASLLLEREGLRASYETSQLKTRSTPALSTFALARGATSDRRQVMQVLGLLGLIAGAAIGAAMASARLNRRLARLTRP
jgi:hypothetical protein